MRFRSEVTRDGLVALAWAAGTAAVLAPVVGPLATALGIPLTAAERTAILALAILQALVLWLRRRHPVGCLLLVVGFQLALAAVLPPDTELRAAAPLVAAYTAGTLVGGRRLVGWIAAAVLVEAIGTPLVTTWVTPVVRSQLLDRPTAARPVDGLLVVEWVFSALLLGLLYGAAALGGVFVATRREKLRLLEAQAEAAVAEQQTRSAMAVAAERARMARELHDIAAHHLTGLVLQASAAERLVDRDPAAAKQAARDLRTQGKEALDNLRAVVGVLRERDPAAGPAEAEAGAPVPGLAVVDALVASARTLGDDIRVSREGQPYAVPPIADVTAYRLLQEALSNARQHAPGQPVRVALTYAAAGLRISVDNGLAPARSGPAPARRGFGLLGMRERAGLAGGRVVAGPTPDGRWRVDLTLPRAPEAVR